MVEGTFVGRTDVLGALGATWARVTSGSSALVWVDGEPGVGKTSLVRQFTESLGETATVWVTADEEESDVDLGVLDDLLHRLARVAGSRGDRSATPHDRQGRRLLDALTGFTTPLVLVIDDLHWVDAPSLAALRFALRRLESDGILVVLTTDPAGEATLGDSWQRFLGDPHLVTRHHLAGLGADELVELADAVGAGRLDEATARRLHSHTRGNALHAIALFTEVGTDGLVAPVPVLPSPRSFAELTRARLAALDGPAQALVRAGSVLGAAFRLGDAALVAGIDDPSAALDAAVRSRLVRSPAAGAVAFEHPLVRGAVYNDLAPSHRRALHHAAIRVTSGMPSLVHRVEATDGPDDELTAEIEAAARAEAAAGDVSRAADLALMAARVASSPDTSDQLVLGAVESLVAGAHLARALTLEPRVAACAPSAHRDHVLALLDLRRGRLESARVRFLAGAQAAAEADRTSAASGRAGDVRARALAGAAFVDWFTGDAASALALANESLTGDAGWGGSLMCYVRAMALVHLGLLDELESRPLPERLPASVGPIDRLAVTGTVHLYLDDLEAAATDLAAAVDLGRNTTSSQLFAMALSILAEVELRRGRWDAAMIDAELAVAFAADGSGVHARIQGHTVAVEVAAGRGRFDDAQAHLDAADELATVLPAWGARTRTAMARAALAIARGDHGALVAAGAELTGGDLSDTLGAFPTWRWRATVADAYLADRDLGAAESAVDRLGEVIEARGWESVSASARASLVRLRAAVARARGDEQAALAEYARITPPAQGRGPLPVARTLIDHGALLLRVGRAPDAVPVLESAERILAGLGAAAFEERCHALLVQCGVQIDLDRPDPLAALTPRQEAVALLVADNLTNKEIAAELIIGLKTVEYHLSQIFTKFDLHSRRDLADLVHRRRTGNGRSEGRSALGAHLRDPSVGWTASGSTPSTPRTVADRPG